MEIFFILWEKINTSSSIAQYLFMIFFAYNIFACFWLVCFLTALAEISFAGAFATWYWTSNKNDVSSFTLLKAISITLKYHSGTAALGSLTFVFSVIWSIISLLDVKAIGYSQRICKTGCARSEIFLQESNRDGYIMCAIYGDGLWFGAAKVDNLILRNLLRYITLDAVTFIVFGITEALLGVAATGICHVYMDTNIDISEISPVGVVMGVNAYLVAREFFAVYSVAVDTLHLCSRTYFYYQGKFVFKSYCWFLLKKFIEIPVDDLQRNGGSEERPNYISERLIEILAHKNAEAAGADEAH